MEGRPCVVSQAMVCGDRHPYPTALVTLNADALARFARDQGILVTDPAQLAQHPKVIDRVGRIVDAANARLQSYAQIKKFAVLPGDFTEEGGELTPTQKVKRKVVAEKYRGVIGARGGLSSKAFVLWCAWYNLRSSPSPFVYREE